MSFLNVFRWSDCDFPGQYHKLGFYKEAVDLLLSNKHAKEFLGEWKIDL